MRIDSAGQISIGTGTESTPDPANLLTMYVGAVDESYATIRGQYNRTNPNNRSEVRFGVESNADGVGFLGFATGGGSADERMRINSNGLIQMGATAFEGEGRLVLGGNKGSANGPGMLVLAKGNTSIGDGTEIGIIRANGGITTEKRAADIRFLGDLASWTSTSLPSRISFWTTNNGATSPTEAMRIDNAGRVIVANAASTIQGFFGSNADNPTQFQVQGTNFETSSACIVRNSDNTGAGTLVFGKTRGTANNTFGLINKGDLLGNISWQGATNNAGATQQRFSEFASIRTEVDANPISDSNKYNSAPGALVFQTAPNTSNSGNPTSPIERMRIDSAGNITIPTGQVTRTQYTRTETWEVTIPENRNRNVLEIGVPGNSSAICTIYWTSTVAGLGNQGTGSAQFRLQRSGGGVSCRSVYINNTDMNGGGVSISEGIASGSDVTWSMATGDNGTVTNTGVQITVHLQTNTSPNGYAITQLDGTTGSTKVVRGQTQFWGPNGFNRAVMSLDGSSRMQYMGPGVGSAQGTSLATTNAAINVQTGTVTSGLGNSNRRAFAANIPFANAEVDASSLSMWDGGNFAGNISMRFGNTDGADRYIMGFHVAPSGSQGTTVPNKIVAIEAHDGGTGALVLTGNCDGIQFGNTSGAAHTLDDYEQGTWTPAISGHNIGQGLTLDSFSNNKYVKIGRYVYLSAQLVIDSNSTTEDVAIGDAFYISGTPFTVDTDSYQCSGTALLDSNTRPTRAALFAGGGNTRCFICNYKEGAVQWAPGGLTIRIQISYRCTD